MSNSTSIKRSKIVNNEGIIKKVKSNVVYQNDLADLESRERDMNFYNILAGGARMRLLETFLDLKLPELLGKHTHMSAKDICTRLGLDENRGFKFLHSCGLSNILIETGTNYRGDMLDFTYKMSDETKSYFGEKGKLGFFFRELITYWRYCDNAGSLTDIIKGATLPQMPVWPPATMEHSIELEEWMTVTAEGAILNILASNAVKGCKNLLDVGGGDGTIAIALVNEYRSHNMRSTVFNIPASAKLAMDKIESYGNEMKSLVSVHTGNFLEDELPSNHDCILFSRVLTDWSPDVCKMLFDKCRRSLAPGGKLVINEAFLEGNEDFVISWEFRYMFYDTFGKFLYKPLSLYEKLLTEAGFKIIKVTPMTDVAFYSVVEAVVA